MPGFLSTLSMAGFGFGFVFYGARALRKQIKGDRVRRARIRGVMHELRNKPPAAQRVYGNALPVPPPPHNPPANDALPNDAPPVDRDSSVLDDTVSALRNLGMTKTAATRLARSVWDQTPPDITLSDMITRCLRALNK